MIESHTAGPLRPNEIEMGHDRISNGEIIATYIQLNGIRDVMKIGLKYKRIAK